jgi:hypothetical protein
MPIVAPFPSDETVLMEDKAEEAETSPYFENCAGNAAEESGSEIL